MPDPTPRASGDADRTPADQRLTFRVSRSAADLYSEVFALIIGLREAIAFDNADDLQEKITRRFERLRKEGMSIGIPQESLDEAQYLLTAFIDETVLTSKWPKKHEWLSHLLQLRYYGQANAGEEVFQRLDRIRSSAKPDPDLLELYFTSLSLGFKGHMAGRADGEKELGKLRDEIWLLLQRLRPADQVKLSPTDMLADAAPRAPEKETDWRLAALVFSGVSVLLVLILHLLQGRMATDVAVRLRNLLP